MVIIIIIMKLCLDLNGDIKKKLNKFKKKIVIHIYMICYFIEYYSCKLDKIFSYENILKFVQFWIIIF